MKCSLKAVKIRESGPNSHAKRLKKDIRPPPTICRLPRLSFFKNKIIYSAPTIFITFFFIYNCFKTET